MRDIKFRAWDNTRNRISHVYTFYVELDRSIKHVAVDDRKGSCDTLFEGEFELMQYTGLKDKNGKEIYEGDIMDYKAGRFFPVVYKKNVFGLQGIDGWHSGCWLDLSLFEIVGNIYENSELITNGNKNKSTK